MSQPTMDELRERKARKPRKGDWVFVVMAGVDPVEPRQHGVCKRCGERLVFTLPMQVDVFVAMTRAFVKAHSHCPAR